MPNHVYNTMTIVADEERLDAFLDKAKQTYVTKYRDFFQEGQPILEQEQSSKFSFRAFVPTPTGNDYDEHLDEEGKLQQPWYDWNVLNWSTKWDAYELEIDRHSPTSVTISFQTAWSPPEKVYKAIASQHPDLFISVYYEEEQGWGGELVKDVGVNKFRVFSEWDIPNSHADYVARDNEDGCNCSSEEDEEYWYDDCPRKLAIEYDETI